MPRDPMALTAEQVSTLAPDASALAAGRKTADPRVWAGLGQSAEALWGECKGSATYQVRVSLADFASKCSCPSRKFPCKHALGLLFLAAQEPKRLPAMAPPDWVAEWLAKRSETATRKQERAEKPAAPPDPKAQAKRAEKRVERIVAGVEGLDLWMCDLARTGFAAAAARGDQAWREQAARLVDAQAPGLASRLKQLGALPRSAPDFAERLADGLGRLALLTHAVRRADALTAPLAADVRTCVGYTLEREEVVAAGERVTDSWAVVGQSVEDEDRVRVQRSWLRGLGTKRSALVLQFAAGSAQFAEALPPGTLLEAELAFWPSAFPLRALVSQRKGEARSLEEPLTGLDDVEGTLAAYADCLARQPWTDRFPVGLGAVVPTLLDAASDEFVAVDAAGASLPLGGPAVWRLFALAGGSPIDLFGEWDGRFLVPLGAYVEGRLLAVASGSADT
jgi:hypothetical protein